MHQIIIDLPFDIDDRFEIEQDDNIEEKMDEIKKYIIKQKALKEIRALKGVLKGIDVSEEEMYMQGD